MIPAEIAVGYWKTQIFNWMTPNLACVSPEDTLEKAKELMTTGGFRRLPDEGTAIQSTVHSTLLNAAEVMRRSRIGAVPSFAAKPWWASSAGA